ncbi:transcriptional regulator [Nocardioides gansuensis]|uniref:Transcriptional regulator n=1 Tax=Nocardioides gansuensis TaxID=2138300 RepID=A0A2T8FF10_9ACTN|nr:PucR family transcriptional regulator [Nocardioides gansuensis]PVG84279.1 transcriptional regulator [Nocardioides gansuensis]
MSRRVVRRATQTQAVAGRTPVALEASVVDLMRAQLPEVADRTVSAIIAEVPSYANALSGSMGEIIRNAVQLALGGFLTLATREDAGTPMAPALEGAYQLGRGEAKSGRSMEALLAAYRIGARVAWRDMARSAVDAGVGAEQLSRFAELVFAYIDELSASSAAGHTDELESSGRVRQRNLERLAHALLTGAAADAVVAAAERAEWEPPTALTAVLMPESQVSHLLSLIDSRTLQPSEEVPGLHDGTALLLVPTAESPSARAGLLRALRGTSSVVGPTVPWLEVVRSHERALRTLGLGLDGLVDTEAHLAEVLLAADPSARADLRAKVLAPLAELRPSTADKLAETLRAWLLHQGRREAVAEELFVHPQTVRYRVGQLRELYGDRLEDPRFVLEATLALA